MVSLGSARTVGAAEGGRIRKVLLLQSAVSEAMEEWRGVVNAGRIGQGEVSGSTERGGSEGGELQSVGVCSRRREGKARVKVCERGEGRWMWDWRKSR